MKASLICIFYLAHRYSLAAK